ncbi:MAG: M15 family metallopeptidase [Acidimicrobiales bacterium]
MGYRGRSQLAGEPTGVECHQHPALVAALDRAGFTWGCEWLDPDAAHFEYAG